MLCLQSAAFDGRPPVDGAKLFDLNGLQTNPILTCDCIAIFMVFNYTGGQQELPTMAVLTPPRPDLLAYREATTLQFPKLVDELMKIIGRS